MVVVPVAVVTFLPPVISTPERVDVVIGTLLPPPTPPEPAAPLLLALAPALALADPGLVADAALGVEPPPLPERASTKRVSSKS